MRAGFGICVLIFLTVGCAPRVRAPLPPQWPATWDGRQLYNTSVTLVYARHESEANDVEDRVKRVQDDFVQRTGGAVHPGLVVVNDTDDPQLGPLNPDEISDKPFPKDLEELGLSRQEVMMSAPIPLKKETLTAKLGFSDAAVQTIDWATAFPSGRRMNQFSNHMIDAGVKKADINVAMKILILPFLPMIRGMVNDMFQAMLDVAIYRDLCDSQPEWTESRRKSETHAYEELKLKKVVGKLEATTRAATTTNAAPTSAP